MNYVFLILSSYSSVSWKRIFVEHPVTLSIMSIMTCYWCLIVRADRPAPLLLLLIYQPTYHNTDFTHYLFVCLFFQIFHLDDVILPWLPGAGLFGHKGTQRPLQARLPLHDTDLKVCLFVCLLLSFFYLLLPATSSCLVLFDLSW